MSTTQTEIEELAESDLNDIDVNQLRLDLYDELSDVRRSLFKKSAGDGRIYDAENEAQRTAKANAFIRSANATIRLLDAIENAQLDDRLAAVEDRLDI